MPITPARRPDLDRQAGPRVEPEAVIPAAREFERAEAIVVQHRQEHVAALRNRVEDQIVSIGLVYDTVGAGLPSWWTNPGSNSHQGFELGEAIKARHWCA